MGMWPGYVNFVSKFATSNNYKYSMKSSRHKIPTITITAGAQPERSKILTVEHGACGTSQIGELSPYSEIEKGSETFSFWQICTESFCASFVLAAKDEVTEDRGSVQENYQENIGGLMKETEKEHHVKFLRTT